MKIIDRPEPEENILAVGFRNVQNAMSPTAWTVVAMAAFLLFIAGMAAYAFASAITLRKVGFFGGLGLLVVCVFANVFAARANNAATSHDYAVVMNDSTQLSAVSREPLNKDEVAFTLHEGAKLKKNDSIRIDGNAKNTWYKVQTADNREAWIKASAIEESKNLIYCKRSSLCQNQRLLLLQLFKIKERSRPCRCQQAYRQAHSELCRRPSRFSIFHSTYW